jgi:hypothetical protein
LFGTLNSLRLPENNNNENNEWKKCEESKNRTPNPHNVQKRRKKTQFLVSGGRNREMKNRYQLRPPPPADKFANLIYI